MRVEPRSARSSMTSMRSRRSVSLSGLMSQSSIAREVESGEAGEYPGVRAIDTRDGKVVDESWCAHIVVVSRIISPGYFPIYVVMGVGHRFPRLRHR